ncbi:MAG: hypothetical protein PUK75_04935 [bacterium]|nr:hypothetical protein [bacterium]MDY4100272.1 hypothetical protein [Lachnospiraceae bacterium]
MDEARIFRERFQQGTAYMSEELKSIEKNATGTFKEPENQQLEREYMSAMEQGHARMRLFGIKETSFGKMEFATTEVMQSYCEERKEASRIRQITESGKKKKSRQETDAQARMGDRVNGQLKRSADASAANVLQMYRAKKEQNHQPADPSMQGTEFYTEVKHEEIDAQTREEQISDLLLKRDVLAERVKNAAPQGTTERLEAEYDKQLLEKLNDVLQTWMMAGGITESGKRVSGREKSKAMQHLSLAVESYEHYVKNRDMLIGGMLFERIKKTDAYKEQYDEWTNIDKEASRQVLDIDQPIMNVYKDDIINLRTLISENGPYAPEMQKLITSVYREYMQHSVAYANMNQEMKAATMTVRKNGKMLKYLEAWKNKNDLVDSQHEMAMDAAAAYLKYLIKGSAPDPTLAVYIEQHWNTGAFVAELDQKADEAYGDRAGYEVRIRERIAQIEQDADLTQEKKASLITRLELALGAPQNQQEEKLLSSSLVEIAYSAFVHDQCQVTDNDPNGAGYRDVVRMLMPVNGSVEGLDAQEAKARKIGFVKFGKGTYLGDQKDAQGNIIEDKRHGMECSKEERLAEFPALKEVVEHAYEDMHAYVQANEVVFQKQSLEDVYRSVETLTKVYKKAQAMRDMCSVICKTPLFDELEKPVQDRMIELWDFGGALTEITQNRVTLISQVRGKTLRELTEDGGAGLRTLGMTIEDYVAMTHRTHAKTLAAQRADHR